MINHCTKLEAPIFTCSKNTANVKLKEGPAL